MDNKLLKISFQNGANTLNVGTGESIKVVYVEGLEASEYTVHTASNSVSDGSTVSGKKVEARPIRLLLSTSEYGNKEILRRQLIHFFNPKETLHMTVNYCGAQASIECEVTEFKPTTETSLWDDFEVSVGLICPYPYFADLDNFGKDIASTTAMFVFPLSFLVFNKDRDFRRGQVMSYTTLTDEVILHNAGDVETGLEIIFVAKKGAVTNPKIENLLTGEFIEVIAEMAQGDEIKINTNIGKKNIFLNGGSIFKQKNKLSTFFSLKKGDNKVKYTAKTNQTNLEVKLYYTPKYLGVG